MMAYCIAGRVVTDVSVIEPRRLAKEITSGNQIIDDM
jgi:hypothetical protein